MSLAALQSAWASSEEEGDSSLDVTQAEKMHLMMAAARAVAQGLLDGLLAMVEPYSTWGISYEKCL